MSHLTCCPACGTTFRVVEDQLRLASGWVRCGVCQHVYDAIPALSVGLTPAEAESSSFAAPPPVPIHVSLGQQTKEDGEVQAAHTDDLTTSVIKPAFVRQAEQQAVWRQPVVRLSLAFLTLSLALALTVQATWLWRDQLVARWPLVQPGLVMLCQWLGCTVGAPRLNDALRIESTALLRGADDPYRYRFEIIVKNTAAHAVAAPALELTLLDVTQMVRLQRIFPPSDWPDSKAQLEAGEIWSVRFEFELNPAIAQNMAGYRAWLFYL